LTCNHLFFPFPVTFHKGKHLECIVDGSIENIVAAPATIVNSPPYGQRSPLFIGGSIFHFAPPAVIAHVTQVVVAHISYPLPSLSAPKP
jgi:hypothetical protein